MFVGVLQKTKILTKTLVLASGAGMFLGYLQLRQVTCVLRSTKIAFLVHRSQIVKCRIVVWRLFRLLACRSGCDAAAL